MDKQWKTMGEAYADLLMKADYRNLPRCKGCPLMIKMSEYERFDCAMYWRPGTNTKEGFPLEDGWECPRDSFDKSRWYVKVMFYFMRITGLYRLAGKWSDWKLKRMLKKVEEENRRQKK